MEGLINIAPKIKKITFPKRGKMTVTFRDGRAVIVPLKYFPSILKLTPEERKKWIIMDEEMFSFENCNEVYHVEQLFGRGEDYRYNFARMN